MSNDVDVDERAVDFASVVLSPGCLPKARAMASCSALPARPRPFGLAAGHGRIATPWMSKRI